MINMKYGIMNMGRIDISMKFIEWLFASILTRSIRVETIAQTWIVTKEQYIVRCTIINVIHKMWRSRL